MCWKTTYESHMPIKVVSSLPGIWLRCVNLWCNQYTLWAPEGQKSWHTECVISTQGVNIFLFFQVSNHLIWMHSLRIFTGSSSSSSHNNNKIKLWDIFISWWNAYCFKFIVIVFLWEYEQFSLSVKELIVGVLFISWVRMRTRVERVNHFFNFFFTENSFACSGRILCTLIAQILFIKL